MLVLEVNVSDGFSIYYFGKLFISKAAVFFTVAVLFFNCAFSSLSYIRADEINGVSLAQKDIFSAVMFVSDAIKKISLNLSSKISAYGTTSQKGGSENNKTEKNTQGKDFISPAVWLQNFKQVQNNIFYGLFYSDSAEKLKPDGKTDIFFQHKGNTAFIFLIALMIFFIFSKNPYDERLNYHFNMTL